MAFSVCVCVGTCCQSMEETEGETKGVRRRPGGKGNAEANHSQLWHKTQVSFVAPGKQQRQGLLGKAAGLHTRPRAQ